jgi:hypothetical protein
VERYQDQLVGNQLSQQEGMDYTKGFALVAKMNSIKVVLSLATSFVWKVHQMEISMKRSAWSSCKVCAKW